MRKQIEARRSELPEDAAQLRELAGRTTDPTEEVAINTSILRLAPDDVVAMNRLGRAYEALGSLEQARQTFSRALAVDPSNAIARRRLADMDRRRRR